MIESFSQPWDSNQQLPEQNNSPILLCHTPPYLMNLSQLDADQCSTSCTHSTPYWYSFQHCSHNITTIRWSSSARGCTWIHITANLKSKTWFPSCFWQRVSIIVQSFRITQWLCSSMPFKAHFCGQWHKPQIWAEYNSSMHVNLRINTAVSHPETKNSAFKFIVYFKFSALKCVLVVQALIMLCIPGATGRHSHIMGSNLDIYTVCGSINRRKMNGY